MPGVATARFYVALSPTDGRLLFAPFADDSLENVTVANYMKAARTLRQSVELRKAVKNPVVQTLLADYDALVLTVQDGDQKQLAFADQAFVEMSARKVKGFPPVSSQSCHRNSSPRKTS